MLRIECYPVMQGLAVHVAGYELGAKSKPGDGSGASVNRTVPTDDLEARGADEVIREVLVDIITEYPGLLSWALR